MRVANAPGTIDSGYRGEIGIIITNTEPKYLDLGISKTESPKIQSVLYGNSYTITKGMRFAQLVLSEVPTAMFYQVKTVSDIGFDRASGFGGSGLF